MINLNLLKVAQYGWVMVFVAFIFNVIAFGTLASVGIFLKPLISEFGWTRGSLSLGYTAATLATAVGGIFWSIFVDKYGSRWIVLFGACILGLPLLLLSQVEHITEYYLFYCIFGLLGHASVTGPLYTSVGLWFNRNVGLALGVVFSGSAVGQGIIPFIARYLIEYYGWEIAYFALGISYIIIAIPLALLVRDAPSRTSSQIMTPPIQKDGSIFPLSPAIVVSWISIAVFFCCVAMSVVVVHLIPLLTDQGMSNQKAVTVFLVLMAAGAVGRIFGGKLADDLGALKSYAIMSILQTLVIFLFPHLQDTFLIYLVAIVFGIAFSGVMASFLICVRMMVPGIVLARSIAVVAMLGWIGMGVGGWQGGLIFDITGNYIWSFANGSLAGFINLLVLFFFNIHIRNASKPTP